MKKWFLIANVIVFLGVASIHYLQQWTGYPLFSNLFSSHTAHTSLKRSSSLLQRFVEKKLSTSDYQVRLETDSSLLSSHISIKKLTVSDKKGVFLIVDNIKADWERLSLFQKKLHISSLTAEKIELKRQPEKRFSWGTDNSLLLELPSKLPLTIAIDALTVPQIHFAQKVFAFDSTVSLQGKIFLSSHAIDTAINLHRTGSNDQVQFLCQLQSKTDYLNININGHEEKNGILTHLLQIPHNIPLDFSIKGGGPYDGLNIALLLYSQQQQFLTGSLTTQKNNQGQLKLNCNLHGQPAPLFDPLYQAYFTPQIVSDLQGSFSKDGGFVFDNFKIQSPVLDIFARGKILKSGFLRQLYLTAHVADRDGHGLNIPLNNDNTGHFHTLSLNVDYGRKDTENWTSQLELHDFSSDSFFIPHLALKATGKAQNLDDPTQRQISFNLQGLTEGQNFDNEKYALLLQKQAHLMANGHYTSQQSFTLDKAQFNSGAVSASASGVVKALTFTGNFQASIAHLKNFSPILRKDWDGRVALHASGNMQLLTGACQLNFAKEKNNIFFWKEGSPPASQEMFSLFGSFTHNQQGIFIPNLKISNAHNRFTMHGVLADKTHEMQLLLDVRHLPFCQKDFPQTIFLRGNLTGLHDNYRLAVNGNIKSPEGTHCPFQHAKIFGNLFFTRNPHHITLPSLSGFMESEAQINKKKFNLQAHFFSTARANNAVTFAVHSQDAEVKGDLELFAPSYQLKGSVKLDAKDIHSLAFLSSIQAKGPLYTNIKMDVKDGKQEAIIDATTSSLNIEKLHIKNMAVHARAFDLFGKVEVNGKGKAHSVQYAQKDKKTRFIMNNSEINIYNKDEENFFTCESLLAQNIAAKAQGNFTKDKNNSYKIHLGRLKFSKLTTELSLKSPSLIALDAQGVSVSPLTFTCNKQGALTVQGNYSKHILNFTLAATQFPLSSFRILTQKSTFVGHLNGSGHIGGTFLSPDLNFNFTSKDFAPSAQKTARKIEVFLNGKNLSNQLNLNLLAKSKLGRAQIQGNIPLQHPLTASSSLKMTLNNFPLDIANSFIKPNQLNGNATGTASLEQSLKQPQITFKLQANNLNNRLLGSQGNAHYNAYIIGAYGKDGLTISQLRLHNQQQEVMRLNGGIHFNEKKLDLKAQGAIPLPLFNSFLPANKIQLGGKVFITNGHLEGSFSKPILEGQIEVKEGKFFSEASHLNFSHISALGYCHNQKFTLKKFAAHSLNGGKLLADGWISFVSSAELVASLNLQLDHAEYSDGDIVFATVSGKGKITGNLLKQPLIQGDLTLDRTLLHIPSKLNTIHQIRVVHTNISEAELITLKRASTEEKRTSETKNANPKENEPKLDLNLATAMPIFVHGMGINVEMGGKMKISGSLYHLNPVGRFQMIRGHFNLLSHSLTFNDGSIDFIGNLEPHLDFTATTTTEKITANIRLSGSIRNIKLNFSSTPTLPEEEILAYLLFNHPVNRLSPFQIVELASVAAQFSGLADSNILNILPASLGLDNFDISTDAQGYTHVQTGKYINNNLYLGVETGTDNQTKGTVNIDLTDKLKAKGSLNAQGNSSFGLIFEKDY